MTTPVPRFRRQVPVGRGGCHKRLERSQVRTAIIDAFKEPFKLEHGDIVIEESLAIIWAIVALAEALGMSTTAEGVESLDQVAQVARPAAHRFKHAYSRGRARLPK